MSERNYPGYSSPVLRFATAEEIAARVKPETLTNYPDGYRSCPTCRAYSGSPCRSAATSIRDGDVVGGPVNLDHPHRARKLKQAYQR